MDEIHQTTVLPEEFPPGTACIEDVSTNHVTRSPVPSSDPNDPLNWSTGRKALQITILSLYTLMVFASNTVSTPLYQDQSKALHYEEGILDASFASNAAALAVGSVLFVPFAIVFGRRIIYIVTSLVMFGCNLWSAETTGPTVIIIYSVLQGLAGSANETLWQMTVCDLFFVHQRGSANAIYLTMAMVGTFVAPVPSGYIAKAYGWRWSYWVTSIVSGAVSLMMIFFLEESKYIRATPEATLNAQLVGEGDVDAVQKEKKQQEEDALSSVSSRPDSPQLDTNFQVKTYLQRLAVLDQRSDFTLQSFLPLFYKPFLLLWQFPLVACGAFVYGFYIAAMNILAVTQTVLYAAPPYNFSTTGVANMNIPPAIGAILGSALGGPIVDRAILLFAKKNRGIYEPEMRLYLVSIPVAAMTGGILLYGLSVAKGEPWIISAIGAGMMGFGLGGTGDMMLTYVQDSFYRIIGSVFVASVFIANILTVILTALITPWVDGIGWYDFFVCLGCICVAVSALTFAVLFFGRRWRIRGAARYYRVAASLGS